MFSKILVKLIDQAAVPAIVLLSVRTFSVVLLSKYYHIPFSIGGSGFAFNSRGDYLLVNSYSTLFMVVILTIGLCYVLLKSYIFHESHITPWLTAKLFSLKLSSFIQASFDLYSQGAVWLSYTYLITLVSGLMTAFSLMYPWVFYVSLTLSILSTTLLIADVENEIKIAKEKAVSTDNEEVVMHIEEEVENA